MRRAMRMYRIPAAIALIALLTLAVAACGDDDDEDRSRGRQAAPTAATIATAAPAATAAAAPAARATGAATAASAAAAGAPADQQRPGPTDTTFRNYGRTPFVDAGTDAVSTFSLDTDRTSYFLALNWARNGFAVEPDSVRAEEWANAFAYGYDLPRDERSFAITSEVMEHPLGGGRHLARVALQAPMVRDTHP